MELVTVNIFVAIIATLGPKKNVQHPKLMTKSQIKQYSVILSNYIYSILKNAF